MRMRGSVAKTTLLALVVVVTASAACAGRDVRGPFRTQFVDAETGKPIEGVVFLAVWHSLVPNLVISPNERFYEAREAVSGPDGRVEIPALTGPIWKLGLGVRFYEFAKEYATERIQIIPSDGEKYFDTTLSALKRLRTREDRCIHAHLPLLIPDAPHDRMPLYVTAIGRERDSLKCGRLTGE